VVITFHAKVQHTGSPIGDRSDIRCEMPFGLIKEVGWGRGHERLASEQNAAKGMLDGLYVYEEHSKGFLFFKKKKDCNSLGSHRASITRLDRF
jgi:hypothetical protein